LEKLFVPMFFGLEPAAFGSGTFGFRQAARGGFLGVGGAGEADFAQRACEGDGMNDRPHAAAADSRKASRSISPSFSRRRTTSTMRIWAASISLSLTEPIMLISSLTVSAARLEMPASSIALKASSDFLRARA